MRYVGLTAIGMILAAASAASAAESATATVAQTGSGGGLFNYTITLHNTGTTPIGTFWYSWIPFPFYDFLKSQPTNVGAPTGWVAPVDNEGAGDGYSIEYYNLSGSNIPVGGSSSAFTFSSPDNLATITGATPYYGGAFNSGVSFIYSGFPESDAGTEFTVTAAPEPGCIGLLALSSTVLFGRRRKA
jgi:hypothetical protein